MIYFVPQANKETVVCLTHRWKYTFLGSRELRTQKLVPHQLKTQSLKVLHLKAGVGQYIAMHATLVALDFFLGNFYPSGPFNCISQHFFPLLIVANTGFCVYPQNKTGHPAHYYRQWRQVPVLSARGIQIYSKTCILVCFFFWDCVPKV